MYPMCSNVSNVSHGLQAGEEPEPRVNVLDSTVTPSYLRLPGRESCALLMLSSASRRLPSTTTVRQAKAPQEEVSRAVIIRREFLRIHNSLQFVRSSLTVSTFSNLPPVPCRQKLYHQPVQCPWPLGFYQSPASRGCSVRTDSYRFP